MNYTETEGIRFFEIRKEIKKVDIMESFQCQKNTVTLCS